jgi:hypothetical protein
MRSKSIWIVFLIIVVVLWLCVVIFLLWPPALWAHGVVGKRLFVEPMATEDANVFSEYDVIVPSYVSGDEGKELELGSSITLQLTENLGLEIEGEWVSLDLEEGSSESGMANPEAVLKYAAFSSPEHEWIATVALDVAFPYGGAEEIWGEEFWAFGTGLFYGKGFGDLPESLSYLRPLMLQGDAVIHHHLTQEGGGADGTTDLGGGIESFNTLSYNFAIYYSVPYLQQFVKDVGIPWPFSRLFPMVELNYERVLNGPEAGSLEGFARPGLLWVGKSVELGLAAVVPVAGGVKDEVDIGVTGIVSLYLDDLFPTVFREPLLYGE